MRRNETIDVIRIMASFAVILCHVELPGLIGVYAVGLSRFAVPFFLMVSGWFLWREDIQDEIMALKHFLSSNIRLFIISALLIGLANTLLCAVAGKPLFTWLLSYWSRKDALFNLTVYNRFVFLNSAVYYLPMVIYTVLIYLLLLYMGKVQILYFLIPTLILANLIRGELLGYIWFGQGNWLFSGIPFVMFGRMLRDKKLSARVPVAWAMVVSGVALTIIEVCRIEGAFLYFGTIPLATGIFCLGIHYSGKKWPSWIAEFGRRSTPVIFLAHCTVRDIVYAIIGKPLGRLDILCQ